MKKTNILLIGIVLIALVILTGCDKLVKNPRTISIKTDKGVATVTYDDTRQFQLNGLANNYFLQNKAENFSMYLGDYSKNKDEIDKLIKEAKEDEDSKFIDNVNINGYKGFGKVNKKTAATEIYIYMDKKNNIILCVRLNAMEAKKLKIDKNNPEKALYKKPIITEILGTLKYKKK